VSDNLTTPQCKSNFVDFETSATIASSTALRVHHLAGHLHSLGPRATFEWACEIIGGADPLARLEVYARLDPGIVHAIGADEMPVRLKLVRGAL
jgi:hypothetical protein